MTTPSAPVPEGLTMTSEVATIELTVNGRRRTVSVAPWQTLLEVLRDELRLTGTK